MNDHVDNDPRLYAIPDIHGHAKGEHKAYADERPIPLSARMLFLWFFHACRRGWPRFMMVTDHMNYLTFEDPAAINLVRRALKLAQAGDLYGAAETASVEVGHAAVVSEGLRRGMRYSLGAEVDNDPRSRPDAQNIVDAMKPDGMIRSVHFLTVDHPTYGPNWSWPFDNPEFSDVFGIVGIEKTWELYMTTLLDAVERLPGNILGHFYVPAAFGHWPDDATLSAYEDQVVDACEARGMAIEFNTRFLYRDHTDEQKAKYLAAYRRLLTKCKAKNVGIAIGSDAHSPKDQGRAFAIVLEVLDACEINELVFPIAGRLARVALRIERKAEPAVAESTAVATDERKAVRKPRTSDAPARSKETSSKRDDAVENVADADAADDATTTKAKSRSKRAKQRPSANGAEAAASLEAAGPSAGNDAAPLVTHADEPAPPDGDPAQYAAVTVAPTDETADSEPAVVETGSLPPGGHDSLAPTPAESQDARDTTSNAAGAPVADETAPAHVDRVADAVEPVLTAPPAVPSVDEPIAPEPAPGRAARGSEKANVKAASPAPSAASAKSPVIKAAATKRKTGAKAKPAARKSAKPAAKATAVKSAAKKAVAKKAAVKKAPAKKTAAKKGPVKKASAAKALPKKAARPAAKKSAAKKPAAKKSGVKKPAPRRR